MEMDSVLEFSLFVGGNDWHYGTVFCNIGIA
jgi:hypothetical protein